MNRPEAQNKAREKAGEKPARFIYCGPNIPGGALLNSAVFKGGFPAHLEDMFEKCPAIKALCVPVSALVATQKALAVTGSAEHSAYGRVLEFLRKGGK